MWWFLAGIVVGAVAAVICMLPRVRKREKGCGIVGAYEAMMRA